MKAMVLTGHGGLDKLVYHDDWPEPEPGIGEVKVRVEACGLNNTDINTRTAWYSKSVTEGISDTGGKSGFASADDSQGSWGNSTISFPLIQGADATGVISAVGEGVDESRIGERVLVDPWLLADGDWMDASRSRYYGSEVDGGFAEYTILPSINALKIQTALTAEQLATFPCAYSTAENLVARTQLQPGETIVIAGASGGVGTAAIQLCKLRGARVIAIASSGKFDLLKRLGADYCIDRAQEDLEASIRDCASASVDVALDVVGGNMFMPLVNALRQGGRYSSSGAISGPMVEFDLRQLIYKDLQFTGATIVPPGTMKRVVSLIEQGLLQPMLAKSFALRDLGSAQEAFLKKEHVGNIVVTID